MCSITATVACATLVVAMVNKTGLMLKSTAHLVILWFTQLSTITPPICMTAFAAATHIS